jgi:hypothetical protein
MTQTLDPETRAEKILHEALVPLVLERSLATGHGTRGAVDGSIVKWEAIVAGTGADDGGRNCPLCAMFLMPDGCGECPVSQRTGRSFCQGSPYTLWGKLHPGELWSLQTADTPEQLAAAKAMLEFLKSLLPQQETNT